MVIGYLSLESALPAYHASFLTLAGVCPWERCIAAAVGEVNASAMGMPDSAKESERGPQYRLLPFISSSLSLL